MARKRAPGTGSIFRRTERGPWRMAWRDHNGRRVERSTRTTDKAAAQRILSQQVSDSALRVGGVVDPRQDAYAEAGRRPLAEHLADWKANLTAKGLNAKHVQMLLSRVEFVALAVGAERLSDLSAWTVQAAIGDLRDSGKSLQTCTHYLKAAKQFSRWLKRDGRIREDPLAHLTGYNVATDRRHERRALTPEEVALLLDTTEHAPVWRGMPGPDRAMLYCVAVGTGFRANELRSLTACSFSLDSDAPEVDAAGGGLEAPEEGLPADPGGLGQVAAPLAGGQAQGRPGVFPDAGEDSLDDPRRPTPSPSTVASSDHGSAGAQDPA